MTEEQCKFLVSVSDFVHKNPHLLGIVIANACGGVSKNVEETLDYARDMEAIAISSTHDRYRKHKCKDRDPLILQKIQQNKDRLGFNWNWYLEETK